VDSALAGELAAWGQRQLTIMPACPEARLVHGDYGPTNILLDGDRVQIIDWEHARWGDPYEDLAKIRAAQRFPEPNGFGSEDVIWRAFTSAWQESANVSWTCDPAAKELYEVYYIVCLAVFFGTLPNHRLHHLRQLVGETPGDPIRGFQDACTAKHGGHDAQHYRLRGEQRP
jgi:hypothetical protein